MMSSDDTATKKQSSGSSSAMNDKATAQPVTDAAGYFDPSDRLFGLDVDISLGKKNP